MQQISQVSYICSLILSIVNNLFHKSAAQHMFSFIDSYVDKVNNIWLSSFLSVILVA